jgi:hypothetical protein
MLLATRNFHSPLASWRAVVSHTVLLYDAVVSFAVVVICIQIVTSTLNQSAESTDGSVAFWFFLLCATIFHLFYNNC